MKNCCVGAFFSFIVQFTFFLDKSHHQAVDEIHVTLAILSCLGSTLVRHLTDVKSIEFYELVLILECLKVVLKDNRS